MALFQFFPNYVWNLSVAIAMESGARIGEIVDMCQPLLDKVGDGEDVATGDFMTEWLKMAEKLAELANEDKQRRRFISAGGKLKRAAVYFATAERMQGHGHPGRMETYDKALSAFQLGTQFAGDPVERVEIPFNEGMLSGYFCRGEGAGPRPVVVFCNGLDSTKELLWFTGLPEQLSRRGISTLCVDQPGTGEALRKHNLPATAESEVWATPWVDWLEALPECDSHRIGMAGISLGGHFAPRAVAYEPRFAAGAVWGANHNWYEVQQARLKREGERPVPHYWKHVAWVFGAKDTDEFLVRAQGMNLNGHLDRIKVPFLVTHGANDRQIPVRYAHDTYDQLTNCPSRELKIFTSREGGVEHVGADNMSFGRDYISDWFAEVFGTGTSNR